MLLRHILNTQHGFAALYLRSIAVSGIYNCCMKLSFLQYETSILKPTINNAASGIHLSTTLPFFSCMNSPLLPSLYCWDNIRLTLLKYDSCHTRKVVWIKRCSWENIAPAGPLWCISRRGIFSELRDALVYHVDLYADITRGEIIQRAL